MANLDAKRGLRPNRNANGGNVMYVEHWRAASTEIGLYQAVAVTAAGLVTAAASNSSNVLGVALQQVAAGTAGVLRRTIAVAADPKQMYIVQASAGGITNLAAYRGAFFGLVSNTSVNSATGQAKGELDTSAAGTTVWTASTQLRCLDLYSGVDNVIDGTAAGSSNAQFIVEIAAKSHQNANNKAI
jgi:hypothetical protein